MDVIGFFLGLLVVLLAGLVLAAPIMAIAAWWMVLRRGGLRDQVRALKARMEELEEAWRTQVAAGEMADEVASDLSIVGDRHQAREPAAAPLAPVSLEQTAPAGHQLAGDDEPEAWAPIGEAPEPTREAGARDSGRASPVGQVVRPAGDKPPSESRPSGGFAWDEAVAGEWLNKLGVLLLVVGVALFLGYSLTHLGPLGRVVLGLGVSGCLLAIGIGTQRQPGFERFAIGLIGGGWAGLYVTAFAMHALPAARVIDDPRLALLLLVGAAAGMITHAVLHGEPRVTAVAYVLGFVAILISPASGFSAVACLLLAASLVIVASRFGWPALSLVGVVSTYATLAIRSGEMLGLSPLLPGLSRGQAVIAVCWLLFEIYDIARVRRQAHAGLQEATLMPLNLCGAVGTALLAWSPETTLERFFLVLAGAYAGSAIARSLLRPPVAFPTGMGMGAVARGIAGGYEAAATVAAVAAAAAIHQRFADDEWRLVIGFMFEAEVLFLIGLATRQRYLQALSAPLFALVAGRLVIRELPALAQVPPAGLPVQVLSQLCLGTGGVLYANRALAWRAGARGGESFDSGFSYAATVVCGLALATECVAGRLSVGLGQSGLEHAGLLGLLFAWLLLQVGLRSGLAEFLVQSVFVGAPSILTAAYVNGVPAPSLPVVASAWPAWIWLAPMAGLMAVMAEQIRSQRWSEWAEERNAVVVCLTVGWAAFVLLLIWHAFPAPLVAVGWALVALAAVEAGLAWSRTDLRWIGHAAVVLTLGRLLLTNFTTWGMTVGLSHRLLTVLPVVLLLYHLAGRLHRRGAALCQPRERSLERAYLWAAAIVLVLLMRFELGRVFAVAGWAILGLALLRLGWRHRLTDLRWQAYAIAVATVLRSWGTHFYMPDALAGAAGPWILGGFVVASLFLCQLVSPRGRSAADAAGTEIESWARPFFCGLGTVLLGVLLFHELPPALLTMGWGIEGAMLLTAGFVLRDRSLRIAGLGVLAVCAGKLFSYDMRNLETAFRILSFMLLGLLMVGFSWVYVRYKSQLQTYF